MRACWSLALFFALGCSAPVPIDAVPASKGSGSSDESVAPPVVDDAPSASVSVVDELPPDLGTRRSGVDWPAFLGPTGDSVSPETGLVVSKLKDGPRLVWQRPVGEGYAMPSISRGRTFIFDRVRNRARLTACQSETGEELWKFEYPTNYRDYFNYSNGPRCCPVVDGGRVYTFGAEGMLHCIRAVDGKPLWRLDTRAKFSVVQNFFGVGSTPVVEGDLLLVQVGGSPPGGDDVPFMELKGNGSGLVAFDKFTGEVRYRASDELAGYAGPVLRTIAGRRWCLLFARGGLVGMDPASGAVDFHFPWRARILESVNAANPVVVGDRVLISETYGPGSALVRIRPGQCEPIWTDADKGRKKSLQCHWNTPIAVDGYVYASSGRHTNEAELRCIELETGKVMWSQPGLTRASLMLVDGHLACLGEDGALRLLRVNPKRYEEAASWSPRGANGEPLLQYPCWAAPALAHGLLYVRGRGRVACLELISAE
jgi:outer membrane protein assembly factor BamB